MARQAWKSLDPWYSIIAGDWRIHPGRCRVSATDTMTLDQMREFALTLNEAADWMDEQSKRAVDDAVSNARLAGVDIDSPAWRRVLDAVARGELTPAAAVSVYTGRMVVPE